MEENCIPCAEGGKTAGRGHQGKKCLRGLERVRIQGQPLGLANRVLSERLTEQFHRGTWGEPLVELDLWDAGEIGIKIAGGQAGDVIQWQSPCLGCVGLWV